MSGKLSARERASVRNVIDTLRKAGLKNYPFHRAIIWLAANRRCSVLPQVDEALRREVTATISAAAFSVGDASGLLDKLRAAMMPDSQLASVGAYSCPLVEIKKSQCETDAAGVTTCPLPEGGPGCDELAGRTYFAKTDGFDVWFASMLFEAENRVPMAQVGTSISIESFTEMILYHEFGHVMHLDPTTTHLFDAAQRLYWEAAKLVPLELRRSRAVVVGHGDMLEFVAYTFGVENARRDRAARTLCPIRAAAPFAWRAKQN